MSDEHVVPLLYKPSAWGSVFSQLPHNEALGGGSAGPGKTMALLMEPMQQILVEHQRCAEPDHPYHQPWGSSSGHAIFLRRTHPMLADVIKRAHRLFRAIDPAVKWNENKSTFTFRSGYVYQFGHCHDKTDWENYLGFEFCLAAGQRIRMADGTFREIQRVRTGDMVATLEGPRRVTATYDAGIKPCVRATSEYQGVTVGTQLFPTTHPVLLWPFDEGMFGESSGDSRTAPRERPHGLTWQDFESLMLGRPESPVRRATVLGEGSDGARSCDLFPAGWRLREWTFPVALHGQTIRQVLRERLSAMESSGQPIEPSLFRRLHLAVRLLGGSLRHYPERVDEVSGQAQYRTEEICACGGEDGPLDSGIATDFQGRCSFCLRPHGGQLLRAGDLYQSLAEQQGDAAESSPIGSRQENRGCTPSRSPYQEPSYPHFYSGESRVRTEGIHRGLVRMEFAGDFQTFDLTVEGANHYIGEFGIVSSQTIILWDELITFEEEQYDQVNSRLRSFDPVLRKMLKIRAMSNPMMQRKKGDNFSVSNPNWVRTRFIDPAPAGKVTLVKKIRMDDGSTERWTSIYMPALLSDNPDPEFRRMYEINLQQKKPHIRQALLRGDWYTTEGSFFAEEWNPQLHICKPFDIPSEWPKWRSMDWGFKLPGCVHWWTMDEDENVFCVDEMKFQGQTDEEVAERIIQKEVSLGWSKGKRSTLTGPADTQLWEQRGDTSKTKAQAMADKGVYWCKADKRSRLHNAELLTKRLKDHHDGTTTPGIVFFDRCKEILKLMPAIQTSDKNSEEPADGNDDHPFDSTLYSMAYASNGKSGLGWVEKDEEDERREERKNRGRWGYGSGVC